MSVHEPVDGRPDVSAWSWMHWAGVLLSLCIAGINGYIGYTTGELPFLAIGGSFLLGVILFVSRYWSSVFYLLGVLHVTVLAVIWILDGMQFLPIGIVNGLLSILLAGIALYLFFEEGKATSS